MPPERVQLSPETLVASLSDSWPVAEVSAAAELLQSGKGKFPPGIHAIPADLVRAVQRERLLAAMLRASAELGFRELNVQDVLDRAGVSRPTFYQHFGNKEDCFLVAFDAAAERLKERLADAAENGGEGWRERLRSVLEELLRFIAEEPDAALTLVVEARSASAAALNRRDALLDHFAACLDSEVRTELADPAGVSPIAAAGTIGGIEALLYNRLSDGRAGDLESLLPSLMYFAVLPFEGPETASEELGALAR